MELIINNSEKVSFFTALKVRKAYENTWTRWMKTWIVIAIIGSYFMFSNGIIQGLIYEGIILTSLIIYFIKGASIGKKLVYSVNGMPVCLYNDQILIGNKRYYYGALTQIKVCDEYFCIFIGNEIIPIRITEGNQGMITYMRDYICNHMFRFNGNILMYNPWHVDLVTRMKALRYTKSFSNFVISALWKILVFALVTIFFEIKIQEFFIGVIAYSIIFCVFYVAREIFMLLRTHKYLGLGISFSDTHIEWLNKKVAYKDVKSVIYRKDYIVINMKRKSLTLFCGRENMPYVANIFELLKMKCRNTAEFNDTKLRNKQWIKEFAWTASVCALLSVFYINIILGYNNMLDEYEDKFEEKYGIELSVLEESYVGEGYSYEKQYNRILILNTIEQMETVLDRFPEEFWDYMKENADLRFVVCDSIDQTTVGGIKAAGLTTNRWEYIEVHMNSGAYTTEETMAHEMFHVMASVVLRKKTFFVHDIEKVVDIEEWNSYNPSGFEYGSTRDKYKKSFVTTYAMTNAEEDMAETFSELIASDWRLPSKYKNESIENKSKFIIEWIEENFEGMPDDAYWNKWFD